MDIVDGVFLGLVRLFIGLILSIGGVYAAVRIIDRLTRGMSELGELKKGNTAIGVLIVGVVLSVALIIEPVVGETMTSMNGGLTSFIAAFVVGLLNVAIALVIAIFTIYISIRLVDEITVDINEMEELKKNNIAIALMMASVILGISFVIKGSVYSIVQAIDLAGFAASFGF